MATNSVSTTMYCLLLLVVIMLLVQDGNAAGDLHEQTFTMKLPLMKPGEVLFTTPGTRHGILTMPKGHIAIKRCDVKIFFTSLL